MYTNIDSFNNKRSELAARFASSQPDIIGITEVNNKSGRWRLEAQDLQLQGYLVYENLSGRGVVLYIREGICSSEVTLAADYDTAVWCEVRLEGHDSLLVGVVYRSPGTRTTDTQNSNMMAMISEAVGKKTSHVLIMGDFNFPGIDWNSLTSSASSQEQLFLEEYQDWFLWQHTTRPTRFRGQQTANILDLVMTNEEGMITDH